MQAPQFFVLNGVNEESNCLSILAMNLLKLALYIEMIVSFCYMLGAPSSVVARILECSGQFDVAKKRPNDTEYCPWDLCAHVGAISAEFRGGQDFCLPPHLCVA